MQFKVQSGWMVSMNRYHVQKGRLPYGPIFLTGVLAGILLISLGKRILLENTGLLDEYTLYHMKYMTVDSSALFYYVLRLRLKSAITLAILATTYLGVFVCAGTAFWYGLSAGTLLATVVIRYGLKGILFAFAGVLPQYIIYVPTILALLLWCENLNRSIYFRNNVITDAGSSVVWPKRLAQLAVILCVLILGCLLESFMNPGLLEKFLKIF